MAPLLRNLRCSPCAGDTDESGQQQDEAAPEALEVEQRSVEVARATRRGVRISAFEAREARREVRVQPCDRPGQAAAAQFRPHPSYIALCRSCIDDIWS